MPFPRCATGTFLSALMLAAASVAADPAPSIGAADYARAEKLLDSSLSGALRNAHVDAHWLDRENRFWYRRDGAQGAEYVLVDPPVARARRSTSASALPRRWPAFPVRPRMRCRSSRTSKRSTADCGSI